MYQPAYRTIISRLVLSTILYISTIAKHPATRDCYAIMSFLESHLITQQSQSPRNAGDPSRSPFVPVRKHGKGSSSPPASPRTPTHSSAQGNHVLTPSTIHNLPSIALQTASPTTESYSSTSSSRQVVSNEAGQCSPALGISPSAPRVRAKITPAATPRRKPLLPGTENADIPTPRGSPALVKRVPQVPGSPQPLSARSMTPTLAPARDFGTFPASVPSYTSPGHSPSRMSGEEAGLLRGTGATTTTSQSYSSSSRGKDNVMVCVR